jgi:hypothetical protein
MSDTDHYSQTDQQGELKLLFTQISSAGVLSPSDSPMRMTPLSGPINPEAFISYFYFFSSSVLIQLNHPLGDFTHHLGFPSIQAINPTSARNTPNNLLRMLYVKN